MASRVRMPIGMVYASVDWIGRKLDPDSICCAVVAQAIVCTRDRRSKRYEESRIDIRGRESSDGQDEALVGGVVPVSTEMSARISNRGQIVDQSPPVAAVVGGKSEFEA